MRLDIYIHFSESQEYAKSTFVSSGIALAEPYIIPMKSHDGVPNGNIDVC